MSKKKKQKKRVEQGLNNKKKRELTKKVKKSLRYSIYDGGAYSAMAGFGDNYINPLAIALGAGTTQIGLLNSIPNLLGSFSQLKTPKITEKVRNRKKIVSVFVLLQILMLVFITLIPLLFWGSWMGVFLLIVLVTLKAVFRDINFPAWGSWMSDLVPENHRGAYFGKRNKIAGLVLLTATFAAGWILNLFSKEILFLGFFLIFLIASIFRMVSWHYLNKMYEPEQKETKRDHFSFISFIKGIRSSNFTKFTFYIALMNFAVYISAPFFPLYVLRDLGFGYINYSILIVATTLASLLAMPFWGRVADKVGNMKVLRFVGFFIPIVPILLLFSSNFTYLIFVEILAGLTWAGFHLCAFNFIYDAVTPQKRVICISYYNFLGGIALFFGASLGSILARVIVDPLIFISVLQVLFLVSGVGRFIVSAVMLPKIKEVRPRVTHRPLLKVMGANLRGGVLYHWLNGMVHPREGIKYIEEEVEQLEKGIKGIEKDIKEDFKDSIKS